MQFEKPVASAAIRFESPNTRKRFPVGNVRRIPEIRLTLTWQEKRPRERARDTQLKLVPLPLLPTINDIILARARARTLHSGAHT